MFRKSISLLVIFVSFFAVGCFFDGSSSGSSSSVSSTPGDTGDTSSGSSVGYFVDSHVAGLAYSTSSGLTGVTDSQGRYSFNPGDTVTFSIGGITLGSCTASGYVTPRTIFPGNNTAALHLAQFLQSVDSDGDPTNGITPREADMENLREIDFEDADFDTFLQAHLPSHLTFVSQEDAMSHMDDTLAELGLNPDGSAHSVYRVFPGADMEHGIELWVTRDGKTFSFLKDLDDGATMDSSVGYITKFGDKVIFAAQDKDHGTEVWISDGTASGTYMLKDINTGEGGSLPRYFTVVGSLVYFAAQTDTYGNELYVTDGTSAGTRLVKDIYTGTSSSNLNYLTAYDGKLYFAAATADYGTELWTSDGTSAGTVMLKDIIAGASSGSPTYFREAGGLLYFRATDDSYSSYYDIWVTDGTEGGTQRAVNTSTSYLNIASCNGKLYYGLSGELYEYDGTTSTDLGTVGTISNPNDYYRYMAPGTTKLYVRGGNNLWVYDGSNLTSLQDDNASNVMYPEQLTTVGDTLYFYGRTNADSDYDLYTSNGTSAGTYKVKDINPTGNSDISYLTPAASGVYYKANDGVNGSELWKSDGTEAGTVMVKDIRTGSNFSSPSYITVLGTDVIFRAQGDKYGSELWKSDGTASGTAIVKDINTTPKSSLYFSSAFTKAGDKYYFNLLNSSDLWVTDGTAAGTLSLGVEASLGPRVVAPGSTAAALGDKYIFTGYDGSNNVMVTDGTVSGTKILLAGTSAIAPVAVGNYVYFYAYDSNADENYLYKTDGTAAGTVTVKDGNGDPIISPSKLIASEDKLFVKADYSDGSTDLRIYVTDGTQSGTKLLLQETNRETMNYFAVANGTLFFDRETAANGDELWSSDGTAAGTKLLKNIADDSGGVESSSPSYITAVGDVVFFTANDNIHGTEVWRSNGSAAGTELVKDVNPGANSSSPYIIGGVGNRLYFSGVKEDLRMTRGLAGPMGTVMVAYSDMDLVQDVVTGLSLDDYEMIVPVITGDFGADEYLLVWFRSRDGSTYLKKIIGSISVIILQGNFDSLVDLN